MLILELAQLLIFGRDAVEGFEHLRLQLGLHGRERQAVFEVVVVVEVFFGAELAALARSRRRRRRRARLSIDRLLLDRAGLRLGIAVSVAVAIDGGRRAAIRPELFLGPVLFAFAGAGERPGIGRFEVDDVAKEDLPLRSIRRAK